MVRFKNRYFLCEIISEDPRCRQLIEERTVHSTVKNVVARMHGDFGLACCSIAFAVKYLNAYTGVILLCCRKDFYRLLWSSLPFITHMENRNQRYPCTFNTLHVGVIAEPGEVYSAPSGHVSWDQFQLLQPDDVDKTLESVRPTTSTIRTCQKFLIRYNRDQLLLLLRNCTSEADRQAIQKSVHSCALVGEQQLQSKDEESDDSMEMA